MKEKQKVSLSMITRDEEDVLEACLASVVHLVDEIIIVDTGSQDNTVKVAEKAGAKVFNLPWAGNFALARNHALKKATGDWILVLDADEILAPVTPEELQNLLHNRDVEGYFLDFLNYLGEGEDAGSDRAVRLFRNKPHYRFEGAIHEQVASAILKANNNGGLAVAPLTIHHYGNLQSRVNRKNKISRNIAIIEKSLSTSPNDTFLIYSLAVEYYRQGLIDEGLAYLQKALPLMTGQEGYFQEVIFNTVFGMAGSRRWQDLIDFVDKAMCMFPSHPDLSDAKSLALQALGRVKDDYRDSQDAERSKSMKLRVLVASPVRQNENILREFLESLERLELSGLAADFLFIDDNNDHNLLTEFARGKANVRVLPGSGITTYICNEETHLWNDELIWKVAGYKDTFLKMALDERYDYLFLVDSDLYLHPKTLVHLVSLEKDIVSEVFWTRWAPDLRPLPQVWVAGQYRMYDARPGEKLDQVEIAARTIRFLQMLSQPGTYKVGGLGACTLISKEALSRNLSFGPIYNLGFVGEDRHFCIRAAVLGLELYADTHYPPFHIYRESELPVLEGYKKQLRSKNKKGRKSVPSNGNKGSKITLAMLVRNEADRYLEKVLRQAREYIDRAVILDDASEDSTVEMCRELLRGVPLKLVSNKDPGFHNEIALRKQLWDLALSTGPDWILILDADELFDDSAPALLRSLAEQPDVFHYSFRLYDMWDENHYREDSLWSAHQCFRPFMARYVPGFNYRWRESSLHCGRFPENIGELPGALSDLRVKHLGWMRAKDRLDKYNRYKKLDPLGAYGILEQYNSILDPRPNLIPWE